MKLINFFSIFVGQHFCPTGSRTRDPLYPEPDTGPDPHSGLLLHYLLFSYELFLFWQMTRTRDRDKLPDTKFAGKLYQGIHRALWHEPVDWSHRMKSGYFTCLLFYSTFYLCCLKGAQVWNFRSYNSEEASNSVEWPNYNTRRFSSGR